MIHGFDLPVCPPPPPNWPGRENPISAYPAEGILARLRGGGAAGRKIKAASKAHQFNNPESCLNAHIYRKLSNENLIAMDQYPIERMVQSEQGELYNPNPQVNMWDEFHDFVKSRRVHPQMDIRQRVKVQRLVPVSATTYSERVSSYSYYSW